MKFTSIVGAIALSFSLSAHASTNHVTELTHSLKESTGAEVFVKPLEGSDLFVVYLNDKVLFTDASGSVLINGDVLSLADNVVVSRVIQEEFDALRRQEEISKRARVDGVDSFLSGSDVHKKPKPVAPPQSSLSPAPSLPELTTPPTSDVVVMGYTQEQVSLEQSCLQNIQKHSELSSLYDMFQTEFDANTRIQCGQVFAGAVVPNLPSTEFIKYEAPNEKASVTIFSDYTCSYCLKEHQQIETLLAKGISVKVYPYGRDYYRERINANGQISYGDYTTMGKNMLSVMCSTDDNSERAELFDTLMGQPRHYLSNELPSVANTDFNSECVITAHRQKLYGDLFTSRATPLHVFSNGKVHRGYLSVSDLIQKAI
ncbi:thioredoxin fold domain-containing protein [Vibrio agarivorans]|uniref:thioredoxin fold domain-containing protein n=1 Tax=Vibrio agarivorans TaxID=153622 RepID=UPI0025B2DB6A|nr:thioredoxin fold domain-containing protein [Vibrio agarivorans]MDN3661098.1 hypothetical protein [Vibrio agarivorans]